MSKRWKPNEEQRREIETMAGLGMPHWQMAAILGVSKDTFEIALKKDVTLLQVMERGAAKTSGQIRKTAYQQAIAGDPRMVQYWLNCRERWTERQTVTHENPDGSAVQPTVVQIVMPPNGHDSKN